MHTRWFAVLVVSLVLVAGTARAQEKGQTGVTFGYPASIGILWHPSASFALRPDFSFSISSNDSSGTNVMLGTTDSTSVGVGVTALFYVHTWDKLQAYVAPRFGYSRTRSTSQSSSSSPVLSTPGATATSDGTGNAYSVSGLVGVQYSLSRRFGVYAETGVGYSRVKSDSTSTYTGQTTSVATNSNTNRTWGTRAGLGAVVYF